jgi:hypothetical protein
MSTGWCVAVARRAGDGAPADPPIRVVVVANDFEAGIERKRLDPDERARKAKEPARR